MKPSESLSVSRPRHQPDGLANGAEAGPHPIRQLISSLTFGVRPGEGTTAWLFFLYFLLLSTGHYISKSVRDSTYVDILGASLLPYAYLAVALVSLPVLLLYSSFAARLSQKTLICAYSVVQATGLVAFWWLFSLEQRWVPVAFWVWTGVAFGIGVSQLWSYANHVFDARQARRLFSLVAAGGLLGAIPGGQIARLVSLGPGTRFALVAAAAVSLVIIIIVVLIERRRPSQTAAVRRAEMIDRLQAARGGLRAVLGSRLLTLIALLMFLAMAVNQMVDLQFKLVVEQGVAKTLDDLTRFFGNFYSVMGLLGFLFQMVFTQRIHRALGVGVGLRVLPASVAAAAGLLIVGNGWGIVAPIVAAYILKLSENGFRHSIEQSTRELLFMPVPSALRLQAKAFIDVFVQRFAKGIAAVALLPITLRWVSPNYLSWGILGVSLVWIWVTIIVRRDYVKAYREALGTGFTDEVPVIDTGDVATVTTLVESLGSSDPRQVVHSLELLAANGFERLVPPLLLHHADPHVRRKVLAVLADAGRSDAISLVERAIGDPDPEVRGAAIQALTALKGEDAAELMLPRLDDPDPRLRAAAVAALFGMTDPELVERADSALNEMVAHSDPKVRVEAAKALSTIQEPLGCDLLIQLLYDSSRPVVRQAIAAVRNRLGRDGPNPLYIPTLISLMGNRRLKQEARAAVVAYGESSISALIHFMNAEEEQIWVRRAVPMTIAQLRSTAAATSLLDCLDESDRFLRRKVIEALAYLRTHNPRIRFRTRVIVEQIRREAHLYLRSFADLWAMSSWHQMRLDGPFAQWRTSGRVPSLLQQVLAQRMAVSVENVFRLLKLIHPPRDVEAALRSLASGHVTLRANALEYLDNTLSGSLRRDVFAVIDDAPAEEKLRRGSQQHDITIESPGETLSRLLTADPATDPSGAAAFAAVYTVYAERLESYYPTVRDIAAQSENPMLKETASWVLNQISVPLDQDRDAKRLTPATESAKDGASMAKMALIEKVVVLQGVELFAFCNSEQVLQLAAIAQENRYAAGEPVYRRHEPPDAMYCVVEGKISLSEPDSGVDEVLAGDTFGVIDILSDQLRLRDASAEVETLVLAIEAEDLFDLLSNNIEIVRALFRQMSRRGIETSKEIR